MPLAAGVVILGGAGWFAWTQFAAGPREDFVEEPVVEIPEIPEYLEEPLETSARAATLALADSLRALAGGLGEAPAPEWLSGNYLANASEFRDVRRYWTALGDYVERVRAAEEAVFAAVYAQQLDSMSMVGPDREALMERATAGFRSARIRREDIYRQLEDVVTAAVALHDFLLRNESSIEYEPAVAGLSRDPVTEALPATEELGEAMWQGVAEITSALDALGALDRVTTGRLLDLLFGKLAQTTID